MTLVYNLNLLLCEAEQDKQMTNKQSAHGKTANHMSSRESSDHHIYKLVVLVSIVTLGCNNQPYYT